MSSERTVVINAFILTCKNCTKRGLHIFSGDQKNEGDKTLRKYHCTNCQNPIWIPYFSPSKN